VTRPRRGAAAVLLGVVLAVLVGAPAHADDVDRRIRDSRITESSGLAASRLHPGVLWTHDDSGHPPRLFAIDADGRTDATLRLSGEDARDWEAVTAFEHDGTPYLAVGDIGDNRYVHPSVRIAILPEPQRLSDATVRPQRVVRLTYPDGARDAEALLADPRTGRLYIVSKALLGADVYRVPESVWPGRTTGTGAVAELEKVASTGASLITDGTFLPDGRMLLRGYGTLYLLPGPAQASGGRLRTLATAALPSQEQGESITVDAQGQVLIGSEGENSPVLRIPLPATGDDGTEIDPEGGSAAPTALPTDPYGVTPAPEDPAPAADGQDDEGGTPLLAAGIGVLAVVVLAGAGFALRRR
jgi:hypothetical protein